MISNAPFINRPIENEEQYQAAAKTPATITLYKHTRLSIKEYYLFHEQMLQPKAITMSMATKSITILDSNLDTIVVDTHEIDEKLIDTIDYCKMILNGETLYFYVQNFNRLSPSTTAFDLVPDLISTIGLDNLSFTGIIPRRTVSQAEADTLPPLLPEPYKPIMPFNTTFAQTLAEPATTQYVPVMASSMEGIEHWLSDTPGVSFSYHDYTDSTFGTWTSLLDFIKLVEPGSFYPSTDLSPNTTYNTVATKLSTFKPINSGNGITTNVQFPSGNVQRQLPLIFLFNNSSATMQMLQQIKAMGGTDMILQPVRINTSSTPSQLDLLTPAYNANRDKVYNNKAARLHHQLSFMSRNGSSQSMMLGDIKTSKIYIIPDNLPDGGLYIGFDTISNPLNTQHPYNMIFLPWRKWQLNIVGNTAEWTDYNNEYLFNKAINGPNSPYDNYKKTQMVLSDKVARSKAIYETVGLVSNLVLGIGNNFLSGGSIFDTIVKSIIGLLLFGSTLSTSFLTGATSQRSGVAAQLTSNSVDYGWSKFETNAALSRAEYDVLAANQYEKLMPIGNKALYDDITSIGWLYETSLHDKDLALFDEFLTTHGEATNDIVSEYKFNIQNTHTHYEYYQIGDGNIRVTNQTTSAATNFAVESILEQGVRIWKQEPGSITTNYYV